MGCITFVLTCILWPLKSRNRPILWFVLDTSPACYMSIKDLLTPNCPLFTSCPILLAKYIPHNLNCFYAPHPLKSLWDLVPIVFMFLPCKPHDFFSSRLHTRFLQSPHLTPTWFHLVTFSFYFHTLSFLLFLFNSFFPFTFFPLFFLSFPSSFSPLSPLSFLLFLFSSIYFSFPLLSFLFLSYLSFLLCLTFFFSPSSFFPLPLSFPFLFLSSFFSSSFSPPPPSSSWPFVFEDRDFHLRLRALRNTINYSHHCWAIIEVEF